MYIKLKTNNTITTRMKTMTKRRREDEDDNHHHHRHHQTSKLYTLLFILIVNTHIDSVDSIWQENIVPKIRITELYDGDVETFTGNTTHADNFKLLVQDGDSLLVGARNIVYNLSLPNLEENRRLEWYSTKADTDLCRVKGKTVDDCHNYIRVLAKINETTILVCGTNSFKPYCRHYYQSPGGYEMTMEKGGEGLCPYDPHHNSTAVFAGPAKDHHTEKHLYVATVARFSGADPLIYRSPLRTQQYDPKHLNAPSFVNALHIGEHVYFFFRETAVEYMNCGKRVYSRVARVCTKDRGEPRKDRWTSFVKARLNCSMPADFPFYFDEIQSTSGVIDGTYNGKSQKIIYAVFTTPANSISASAICAYRLQDIYNVFNGPFKGQETSNSNWLPIPASKTPMPRPGQCVNDSTVLPETTLNFLKDYPLMDESVQPLWRQPIVVHTSLNGYRFTHIAVDEQLETVSGKHYDVLYIGTADGRVIKAINSASSALKGHHNHNQVVPVIIEDITVFPEKYSINNLLVYRTLYEAKLIVVSDTEIRAIPLHKCKLRASSCGQCVALQDPHCAWDISEQKCTGLRKRLWSRENFVQNIEEGWDPKCPDGRPNTGDGKYTASQSEQHTRGGNTGNANSGSGGKSIVINENDISDFDRNNVKLSQMYSGEMFAFGIITSIVSALTVGFIFGYIFSRRCRKEDPNICSPYDDPPTFLDHHHHHQNIHHQIPSHLQTLRQNSNENYSTIGNPNNKPINLVLNVPPKNGKNANSSADNKPIQKMKKIYL